MKQSKTLGSSALLLLLFCLSSTNGFLERNVRQTERNFFGNIWPQSYEMSDGRRDSYRNFKLLSEQNKEFRDLSRLDSERIGNNFKSQFQLPENWGVFSRDFSERRNSRLNLITRDGRDSRARREARNLIDRARIGENVRLQSDSRENRRMSRDSGRFVASQRNFNTRDSQARDVIDRARMSSETRDSQNLRTKNVNTRDGRITFERRDIRQNERKPQENPQIRNERNSRLQRVDSRENRRLAAEFRENTSRENFNARNVRITSERRDARQNTNERKSREARISSERAHSENRRFVQDSRRVSSERREARQSSGSRVENIRANSGDNRRFLTDRRVSVDRSRTIQPENQREIRILDRRLLQERDRRLSDATRRISTDENNNVVLTRQSPDGRRMATSFNADYSYFSGGKSSALINALQLVLVSAFIAQIVGSSKSKRNWVYDFVTVTKEKVL